jgi:hypothetical protein
MRIFLIAPGPSCEDYKAVIDIIRPHGELIGVNNAGIDYDCPEVVTMDRLWLENSFHRLKGKRQHLVVRESVWTRYKKQHDPSDFSPLVVMPVPMDHEKFHLSLATGKLNGRNSGFCAFNYAVQRVMLSLDDRDREIYLFGFDMDGDAAGNRHYHKAYSWSPNTPANCSRYRKWAVDFDEAKAVTDSLGIKVFNCSLVSRISKYRKLSHNDIESIIHNGA